MNPKKIETFDNNYKLEIQILQAKITSIEAQDCDPFAICSVGTNRYQTNILRKTNTPQWEGKMMIFEIENTLKDIQIDVFKKGHVGTKSLIGSSIIILSRLGNNIATTQWYDLIQNNEKVGSIQCTFKRQKVNENENEEEEIQKEKGWIDLLSQINDIIQPNSTNNDVDESFIYYDSHKEKEEEIVEEKKEDGNEEQSEQQEEKKENETEEDGNEKEEQPEEKQEKKEEIKEKKEKRLDPTGPINGILKIEIENPINNIKQGQKGIITMKIPPTMNVEDTIWNMIFPYGMTISEHPRKPYLLPLFVNDKQTKEKIYYMFIISDTKMQENETTYYSPVALGLTSIHPLYEMMRRILLVIYESCPELSIRKDETIDMLDGRDELKEMVQKQIEISQTKKTMNSNSITKSLQSSALQTTPFTTITKGLYDIMFGDVVTYGGYSKYRFDSLNIEIRLPLKNSLPLFNTPIYPLFSLFNVSGMTSLFLLLMTNLKIVLFSSSLTLLSSSIDNLVSLLYPFQPTQKVIPILPYGQLDILTGKKTFIVGIPNEYSKQVKEIMEKEECILVDLDNGMIEMNVSKDLLEFPVDLTLELQKDLNETFKEKYIKMDELGNEPYEDRYYINSMHSFDLKVRLSYFKFITKLLEGYENYINYKWIADIPVYDFDIFRFLLIKSIDSEHLIQHFCESGTFMKYIKKQGFDTVFNEWISKRIFENDLNVLYNHYMKNKKILVINPTNQQICKQLHDIQSFSIDWKDILKIKASEQLVSKYIEKDKYYIYELDKFQFEPKKQGVKDIWYSVFQQFIEDLKENRQPDMEKVYQCSSSQSGRHLLLSLLYEETEKMKPKGFLEKEAFEWLLQLMKTLVIYCRGDKDIETPLGIIDCSSQYYWKPDNFTFQCILDILGKNEIWNNETIWVRMFNKHMVEEKKKIYGEKYSLQLPSEWLKMSEEEQKKYREKEENSVVTVLHLIAKNMKLIGVSNEKIYNVIDNCEKEINASEDVKQTVLNVIKIIIEHDSFDIR